MTLATRSEVSIDLISCEFVLPRDHAAGALRHRLQQVLETRLAGAIDEGLAALNAQAPDAVWVIRSLESTATVPASIEDLDALATHWGGQLAADIVRAVVAAGEDVVQYRSPAAQLADFAVALAGDRADSWMYGPLAGLKLLRPTAAIATGAQGAGIPVTDVVDELIGSGRLELVLASASRAEAVRLWAQCVDAAIRIAAPRRQLVEALRALIETELPGKLDADQRGATALRLVKLAYAAHPAGPEVYAAAAVALGDVGAAPGDNGPARRADEREPPARAAPGPADDSSTPASDSGADAPSPVRVFSALGAPAFMLLRSLEQLALDAAPADARASVLAMALRCDPGDEALALAAGVPSDSAACSIDEPALLAAVRRRLVEDHRLDGRWLRLGLTAHPDGRRTVALVSDLVTDTWLVAGIYDDPEQVPWAELIEQAGESLTQPWRIVDDQDTECARYLQAPRRDARDLEWLDPPDGESLAVALVARAVARDFASRLPGFAGSSLGYLAARFLPTGGTIEVRPERIEIELPPAELSVILTMAGLERFSVRVPWLTQEVAVVHRSG